MPLGIDIRVSEVHIHIHTTDEQRILKAIEELKKSMPTQEQFKAGFDKIDAETTRLGNLIKELVAKLQTGGLTEEQEAAVLATLNAAGDRLALVGTDVENPVPPDDGSTNVPPTL